MTKYINKTQYTALQLTDDETEKKILGWILPLLPEETDISEVDLADFRAESMWAILHPDGNVAFVPAADFLMNFEEVEGIDSTVDPLGAFEEQLSANEDK